MVKAGMMKDKLDLMFSLQSAFQIRRDLFNGEDKERETKELVLGMISEISSILDCISWKPHRTATKIASISNIKEELIDVFKYWLILSRIWGFEPEEIFEEFNRKGDVVQKRWEQEFLLDLDSSQCICVDLDGVLCDYVKTWLAFLEEQKVEINGNVENYIDLDLSRSLKDPSRYTELKRQFREEGWKRKAYLFPYAKEFLDFFKCKNKIAIVSARPEKEYRRIFSDTVEWFQLNNLSYDALIFEEEKRKWVAENAPNVRFHVEDDPSQAIRMANFGIKTYLIDKVYNQSVEHRNIVRVDDLKEIMERESEDSLD